MRKNYCAHDLGKSFGFVVCVMLLAQIVFSLMFAPFMQDGALPNWAYWTMQALYTCVIGASAIVYAKISNTQFFSATATNKPPKWAHILWGCLADVFLIALMVPLNNWILDLIEKIGLARPSVEIPMQIAPMLFIACLLPAVSEEIVFRGTVGQSLRNGNKIAALAISGALFALFHLNPAQTLHQFVLGAFLTLLVFRSGSLWTSVAVHLFNNVVAVVLSFVFIDDSVFRPYYLPMFAVGAVCLALCIFGYLKSTKSCWQTEDDVASEMSEKDNICSKNKQNSDNLNRVLLVVSVVVCAVFWVANLLMKN